MKIGITSKFGYGFFANGLNQNIILLYEILESIGWDPIFIDFSERQGDKLISHKFLDKKKLMTWGDFNKDPIYLDLLLCPAISSNESIKCATTKKNPKCKHVSIKYGNNLISTLAEWFSGEKTKICTLGYGTEFTDGCLISPHYKFAKEYYEHKEQCQVGIIPYIWSPKFIEEAAFTHGLKLDYRPVVRPNIAIMEPNINITKNFYIPLLAICEILAIDPLCFDSTNIYCSQYRVTAENKADIGKYLHKSTILSNHPNRVHFKGRVKVPFIFKKDNPLVLSFQHLNELNYIYLEALHFGYPLVHNSDPLKDCGYFYQGFNLKEASRQTMHAITAHNDTLEGYRSKSQEEAFKYSPANPRVIEQTKLAIEQFC